MVGKAWGQELETGSRVTSAVRKHKDRKWGTGSNVLRPPLSDPTS